MREAIILAAGFGTRLRPITYIIPKAIFPVLQKPLLVWQIERLKKMGYRRFYVNLHYLSDKVVKTVKRHGLMDYVVFQYEDPILLTGGGLKGLLYKAEEEDILVHNVDILEEFEFGELFRVHREMNNDITWGLIKKKGNVRVDNGKIVDISENGFMFTGIGVYKKSIVSLMPDGRFSLVPWMLGCIKSGRLKVGYVFFNGFWVDMGTPYGIFSAYKYLLKNKSVIMGHISDSVQLSGFVYIGEGVRVVGTGIVEDAIILGNTYVEGRIEIRRSVIYDNKVATF